jgi:glycosyltransferase involved in cell wall biosynthesis
MRGVPMSDAFLVWYPYQRRVEVLAPKLGAKVFYLPNLFGSKMLRPLDYLVKLIRSIGILRSSRARVVFVQWPPLYGALAALILRVPFVIDAHHGMFRGFWSRAPFWDPIFARAVAVIVHHRLVQDVARERVHASRLLVIPDPVEPIIWPVSREPRRVLFICSFDPNEPIEIIAETIEAMPDYNFYITANTMKLSPAIRVRLKSMPNLTLTGFLATEQYQRLLCSSAVAVDLDESEYAQPSGACEALASDTPLVVSSTALTRERFGEWAWPVEHRTTTIVSAIRNAASQRLDLGPYRDRWNLEVDAAVAGLGELLEAGTTSKRSD